MDIEEQSIFVKNCFDDKKKKNPPCTIYNHLKINYFVFLYVIQKKMNGKNQTYRFSVLKGFLSE